MTMEIDANEIINDLASQLGAALRDLAVSRSLVKAYEAEMKDKKPAKAEN